jgi:hypothetical protein
LKLVEGEVVREHPPQLQMLFSAEAHLEYRKVLCVYDGGNLRESSARRKTQGAAASREIKTCSYSSP